MYTKKPFERDEHLTEDPKERRTIKRRHLIYYLRVWDRSSGEMLGHVVDITTEGMMLLGEKQLPVDRTYDLELRWHNPETEEDRNIAFRARSKWSSVDVNKSFYDTGMQLLDEAEDVLQPIRELIEHYGFQD